MVNARIFSVFLGIVSIEASPWGTRDQQPMSAIPPSTTVVRAVADYWGIAPSEVEPVLYRVIEPDALDRLFLPLAEGRDRPGGFVVFQYGELEIRVHADGSVSVEDSHRDD